MFVKKEHNLFYVFHAVAAAVVVAVVVAVAFSHLQRTQVVFRRDIESPSFFLLYTLL
jgi:hypothetical protein